MKIAVLVSGGVDSSVALTLLKNQGHELEAFYLKIWLEDELSYLGNCPWTEDLEYAQGVCDKFGVPLHVIPLQKEYHELVVAYAIEQVRMGRTPSPDLMCNEQIKFGCFYNAIDASFEKVATGHYAQLEERDGLVHLIKAKDPIKDQTYFLSRLNQAQLQRAMFPIGHLMKSEVRELAHTFDLPTKARKDSQGICFLGKIHFGDFIKHHVGTKVGDLIEFETGKKLSEHEGFWFYTIGQRKGIGLSHGPWYVVAKDIEKNIVFISNKYHEPDKLRNQFDAEQFNWTCGVVPTKNQLQVKIRHGEHLYNAEVTFAENGQQAHVILDGCDQGIAPGQFAVFYDGDECLGSGVID